MAEPTHEPKPLDPAVLDGRGGHDRLIEIWEEVRRTVAEYARHRTGALKAKVEALLQQVAIDLAQDVKLILPRESYPDLWRSALRGYSMNPICNVTLVPSTKGMMPDTLHRLRIIDEELVRFLQIADSVLARLRAPSKPAPAPTGPDLTQPLDTRKASARKQPSPIRWSSDVKNRVTVADDEVQVVLSPVLGRLFLDVASASPRSVTYVEILRQNHDRGRALSSTQTPRRNAYRLRNELGTWLGQHLHCDGTSASWQPPDGSGAA
jgi:hypothetical protein